MELWYPPTDQPHRLEWWRPLILAGERAREAEIPWPIHLDDVILVGRVDRASRPSIWVYRHARTGGELYLDPAGQAYRYILTPQARSHGRFATCSPHVALGLARLPEPAAAEPVPSPSQAGRRRRHLRLVWDGAHLAG